jgi:membrane dipeptidase
MKKTSPSHSRRDFLVRAAGAGGGMLLGPAWLSAASDAVDPRVAEVVSHTIGIDMHNHVYPPGTEPHPQQGPPGGQPPRGPQARPPEEQQQAPELLPAEELKRAGLTAVRASFVLDFAPNKKPGDARDNLLRWFAAIDAQLEKGHIRRALNLTDLHAAHDRGKPTIVQTVEGAMFSEGRLDRVAEVYQRGLRHLQLLPCGQSR